LAFSANGQRVRSDAVPLRLLHLLHLHRPRQPLGRLERQQDRGALQGGRNFSPEKDSPPGVYCNHILRAAFSYKTVFEAFI